METTLLRDAVETEVLGTIGEPSLSRLVAVRRFFVRVWVAVTAIDLVIWFCVALGTGHVTELWWVWPSLSLGAVVGLLSYASESYRRRLTAGTPSRSSL